MEKVFGNEKKDFDVIAYDRSTYGLIVRFNCNNINSVKLSNNTYYELSLESGKIALNGVVFSTHIPSAFQSSINTLTIFARHLESTSTIICGASKIYYFRLYDTGKPIFNFVPCYRKSDNVKGLYDIVEGKFYTNQVTGDDFIAGENVY